MKFTFSLLITAALLSGCIYIRIPKTYQRSLPVAHAPISTKSHKIGNINSIGVVKWGEHRAAASGEEHLADKAIYRVRTTYDMFLYGVTWQGDEYVPLVDFIRGCYIQELQSLGVNVKEIDILPAGNDISTLGNFAQSHDVDFLVAGNLMILDSFCYGTDCSQKIAFLLTMVDKDGKSLMTRELFEASGNLDRSNSSFIRSLGFMESISNSAITKQLTNDVLNESLEKAIARTVEVVNKSKTN